MPFRVFAGFCVAVSLAGQTPAPVQPDSPATVFRSATQVVQVNVVVRSKGKPVDDLMPPDFQLFDRGQPQRIAFFSVHRGNETAKPAQSLPPGVYSNQVTARGENPPAVTVILLDALNTRWSDQAWAKQQVVRFLETLQPDNRVAVFALGYRLRVLLDFSSDFARLQRALARFRGESLGVVEAANPEPVETGISELNEFLDESNRLVAAHFNERRMRITAEAFEGIARYLGRIPGRKNLLWVSGSFPLVIGVEDPEAMRRSRTGIRTFHRELERAARALNDADIAVYPVDARGLQGADMSATTGSLPGFGGAGGRSTMPEIDTMKKLAADTGGRAFYNTNGLTESIHEAIADTEVTYTLGFYPAELEGKYHELKVEVARKGVQVRHRRGYYATPEGGADRSAREAMIREAAIHPLDAGGIGLIGGVTPAGPEWRVRYYVEANRIALEKQDGRWRAELDCVFVQQAENGDTLKAESRGFSLNLTDEDLGRLRRQIEEQGLLVEHRIKPEKDTAQVRLVVYDRRSGRVGSLRLPPPAPEQAK